MVGLDEGSTQTNLENKRKYQKGEFNKVVVQGAGPIGLYTALRFFQLGMHIPNGPKLRFILGSKFDDLFGGQHPPGQFIDVLKSVQIGINLVEDALKQRLVELASLACSRNALPCDLHLLYQTAFTSIQFPTTEKPGFYASLIPLTTYTKKHTDNSDSSQENIIEETDLERNALPNSSDQPQNQSDEEKTNENNNADKKATHHPSALQSVKKVAEFNTTIAFDVLILAGGTNDKARDEYLGLTKQMSKSNCYGASALLKGETYKGKNLLPIIMHYRYVVEASMFDLKPFIEAQSIEKFVRDSTQLPDEIRIRFKNLNGLIFQGIMRMDDKLVRNTADGHYISYANTDIHETRLALFARETATFLYVGGIFNDALYQLLDELDQQKKLEKDEKKRQTYDKFSNQLKKKWFAAVANMFISQKEKRLIDLVNTETDKIVPEKLNFDPEAVNATAFRLVNYTVKKPVKMFSVTGTSAIVVAVGDSAFNSHFFSGQGLSNGRFGVENVARLFKSHDVGEISQKNLLQQILEVMEVAKKQGLATGLPYLPRLEEQEVDKIAFNKMCERIALKCDEPANQESMYKLVCTKREQIKKKIFDKKVLKMCKRFSLTWNKTANKKSTHKSRCIYKNKKDKFTLVLKNGQRFNGTVTSRGKISVDGKSYETLVDAALLLQQN
uniref:Uncharacterized protein n=1 Tax=Ditylenchus dipsaci TaxID=166011 RepID=A0A915D578_9BILA